jgi:hypothetical protein
MKVILQMQPPDQHKVSAARDFEDRRSRSHRVRPSRRLFLQTGAARKWSARTRGSGETIVVDTSEITYMQRADGQVTPIP